MATHTLTRPMPKAIFFDFMGTCLDWHSSITNAILSLNRDSLSRPEAEGLAMRWRLAYFAESKQRIEEGMPPEDIDVVHRKVLDKLLEEIEAAERDGIKEGEVWSEDDRKLLVEAWHSQKSWPDVKAGLDRLRSSGKFDLIVHANGSTRLQLDLVRSSGLQFDTLMSSMMLGYLKPDPRMYLKALDLLQLEPKEVLMVAAHRNDVAGARAVMQTAYIWRETEDPNENMEDIERENDEFIDGRGGGVDVGIARLANFLLGDEMRG